VLGAHWSVAPLPLPAYREEFEKNEGLLVKVLPLEECEASCSYHGICQTSDYYSPMCICFHVSACKAQLLLRAPRLHLFPLLQRRGHPWARSE
jgi:hypothetical protein